MAGDAPFGAGQHEVLDPHVGEGAPGHHPVVASPRAVAVEIFLGHAILQEISAGGGTFLDAARGRNVVGGDRVTEDPEGAGAANLADGAGLEGEVGEEGWFLNVSAPGVPRVGRSGGGGDFVPLGVLRGEVTVELAEGFRFEAGLHDVPHFAQGWPDLLKLHGLAILGGAEGFGGEIDIDPTGDSEGHDQRWGHEEVGFDALVHARFEVAVARKDGGRHDIQLGQRVFHRTRQGTGVADAGGAAVAHDVEAEPVQIRLQAGLVEVIADDTRAWGEGGFHHGVHAQTAFDGFFGQQSRREHDAGVGRVGATGDGGDEDAAVTEVGVELGKGREGQFLGQVGRGVLVAHLRFARFDGNLAEAVGMVGVALGMVFTGNTHAGIKLVGVFPEAAFGHGPGEGVDELLFQPRQLDAVLRPLRSGNAWDHGAQVEFEFGRVGDLAPLGDAEQALGAVVVFVNPAMFVAASSGSQVVD